MSFEYTILVNEKVDIQYLSLESAKAGYVVLEQGADYISVSSPELLPDVKKWGGEVYVEIEGLNLSLVINSGNPQSSLDKFIGVLSIISSVVSVEEE